MKNGTQRVLVFDKDKDWAEAARSVLRTHGFSCDIETKKFDRCLSKAGDAVYLAAIINVHALDEPELSVQRFAADFPSTQIIMLQDRADPEFDKLFWRRKEVYGFFVKNNHPISEIGDMVREIARRPERSPGRMKIAWPDNLEEILKGYAECLSGTARSRGGTLSLRVLKEELDLVTRKMFSDGADGEPIATQITVEPFGPEQGHSASSMFKLTPAVLLRAAEKSRQS